MISSTKFKYNNGGILVVTNNLNLRYMLILIDWTPISLTCPKHILFPNAMLMRDTTWYSAQKFAKKSTIYCLALRQKIFFSIYNSLCDYKMHYGKIMNEVMIIVKFATSKLGILYSWLCFFKPSNCHHQGLFAFCNRRCFRYVSLCIFF